MDGCAGRGAWRGDGGDEGGGKGRSLGGRGWARRRRARVGGGCGRVLGRLVLGAPRTRLLPRAPPAHRTTPDPRPAAACPPAAAAARSVALASEPFAAAVAHPRRSALLVSHFRVDDAAPRGGGGPAALSPLSLLSEQARGAEKGHTRPPALGAGSGRDGGRRRPRAAAAAAPSGSGGGPARRTRPTTLLPARRRADWVGRQVGRTHRAVVVVGSRASGPPSVLRSSCRPPFEYSNRPSSDNGRRHRGAARPAATTR